MQGQIIWQQSELEDMSMTELIEIVLGLQVQVTNQSLVDPVSGKVADYAAHGVNTTWQRLLNGSSRQIPSGRESNWYPHLLT